MRIKVKILAAVVLATCLIVIGNIKYNEATPELHPVQAVSSTNENLNKEPNEKLHEQSHVIPDKNPRRAQPGHHDIFMVKVSITQQKVFIQKNGKTIRTIICSTGLSGKDTPLGSFKINGYYGLNFYNNKYKQGANYWVGFKKAVYLFHSVPVDKNGNIIEEEADKLGSPASHGCIRMSMNDAYWFYETIPQGTDVIIQR